MNTQLKKLFILFIALGLTSMACDDNNSGGGGSAVEADIIADIPAESPSIVSSPSPTADLPGDTASTGEFTLYDLETGEIVEDSLSAAWDVGFSQTTIIANTGNGGGIQVVEEPYADANTAPASGYVASTAESSADWYNYNAQQFLIEVLEDRTIYVRTPDDNYAKLDMSSYYNSETEEPRYFTFFYTLQSNGSNNLSNIVYYDLDDQVIVDAANSSQWDIAFGATSIYANEANGGGILPLNTPFEQVDEAPASGYQAQNRSWYMYTAEAMVPNHAILPIEGITLVLRTPDGNYAKVRILSYYEGNPDTSTQEFANFIRPDDRYYTFEYQLQTNGTTNFE